MKADVLAQTRRRGSAQLESLYAGLGLLSVLFACKAGRGPGDLFNAMYTFTTLTGKTAEGNAGATRGTRKTQFVDPKGLTVDATGNFYGRRYPQSNHLPN